MQYGSKLKRNYTSSEIGKMDTQTHKAFDLLQHVWPYISGMFITLVAIVKFWFAERKALNSRIKNLEIIAENSATKAELYSCKEEVYAQDLINLEKIYEEIKILRKESQDEAHSNSQQHQDIMNTIIRMLSNGR